MSPEVGQFVRRPALANGQALCAPDTRWEAIMSVTSGSSGRHSVDLLLHNFWREEESFFFSFPFPPSFSFFFFFVVVVVIVNTASPLANFQ